MLKSYRNKTLNPKSVPESTSIWLLLFSDDCSVDVARIHFTILLDLCENKMF